MAEEIEKIEIKSNLNQELKKFPFVTSKTEGIVMAIAERAREMAPVESGAYRDGIQINRVNDKGVARVVATDQKSSWIEFGNVHQPGYFVIRSAAESLGLTFSKKGE